MSTIALTYLALAVVATAFALILYFTLTAEIKKWRNENLSLKLQIKELLSKLRASLPRSPFHGKRGKDKAPRKMQDIDVLYWGGYYRKCNNLTELAQYLNWSRHKLSQHLKGKAVLNDPESRIMFIFTENNGTIANEAYEASPELKAEYAANDDATRQAFLTRAAEYRSKYTSVDTPVIANSPEIISLEDVDNS